MTITLRDVPDELGHALRSKATAEAKTVDQVAVEALRAGLAGTPVRRRDLTDLVGTWVEDPEFDAIMKEQDRI